MSVMLMGLIQWLITIEMNEKNMILGRDTSHINIVLELLNQY